MTDHQTSDSSAHLSTNHSGNPRPQLSTDAAIRQRRTHKRFARCAISSETINELVDLAVLAPNHRLTQPWRFAALDHRGIDRLSMWLADQDEIAAWPDPAKGPAKITKLRTHYLANMGALIQVTWVRDPDPERDLEDHAAVCAAVQNILLAATARGLASFWSTSAALRHPSTLRWFGADPEREGFVASIWLGSPVEPMPKPPPRRPLADVLRHP